MSRITPNLSLAFLQKQWKHIMPDCGETDIRTIQDNTYHLTWMVKHNYKRMLRRKLPKPSTNLCPFCLAAQEKNNVLENIGTFTIFGNKFPIEPMHLLLFNSRHRIDPVLADLLTIGKLLRSVPELKILISNRKGSGASVPDHLHIHAFVFHLPIEDAKTKTVLYKSHAIAFSTLHYPAWTVRITYTHSEFEKVARLISHIMYQFPLPFNITITNENVYIIPRSIEDPQICQNLVDGVGSLETAGVFTTVSKEVIQEISLTHFHQGLQASGFIADEKFQLSLQTFIMSKYKKL